MTNSSLKEFKKALHCDLLPKENGKNIRIREMEAQSAIKHIDLCFQNRDDVVVIQQDPKKCRAIQNLFGLKETLESCDFIVLICKNSQLEIFFCEIKSSFSNEIQKKAIGQIESSKIFLEYLFKNYEYCFHKNIEINIDLAKNILIYPSAISQKRKTYAGSENNKINNQESIVNGKKLSLRPIYCDEKGRFYIPNGYEFLYS